MAINRKEILIPVLSGVALGLFTWVVGGALAHDAAFTEHADYTKWENTDPLAVDEKTGENVRDGLEKAIDTAIVDDSRIALLGGWKLPAAVGLAGTVVVAASRRFK